MSERRYYKSAGSEHDWKPFLKGIPLRFVYKERFSLIDDPIEKKWVFGGMYFYSETTDDQDILYEFFSGEPFGAFPKNTIGNGRAFPSKDSKYEAVLPYYVLNQIPAAQFAEAVKPYLKDKRLIANAIRSKIAKKKYEDSCRPAVEAAKEAAKRKKEQDAAKFLDDIIGH